LAIHIFFQTKGMQCSMWSFHRKELQLRFVVELFCSTAVKEFKGEE